MGINWNIFRLCMVQYNTDVHVYLCVVPVSIMPGNDNTKLTA